MADPTSSSCSFSFTGVLNSVKDWYKEKEVQMEKTPSQIAKTAAIALAVILSFVVVTALMQDNWGFATAMFTVSGLAGAAVLALFIASIVKHCGLDSKIAEVTKTPPPSIQPPQ